MRWVLSLLVIGVVGIVLGSGTFAYFSDTEESKNNYIEAGTLDLKVNGTDDPGVLYEVENVYPGWSDTLIFPIKNAGSLKGYLYVDITVSDEENGVTEPEGELNDDVTVGELSQYVDVTLYINGTQVWTGKLNQLEGVIEQYYIALDAGQQITVQIDFSIGSNVGNIIQSDKVTINATWYLDQNPPTGRSEYVI